MSLTDTAIRNAKPKDKAYKLTDEKGLYLRPLHDTVKHPRFSHFHF